MSNNQQYFEISVLGNTAIAVFMMIVTGTKVTEYIVLQKEGGTWRKWVVD
jgi:hypothetical protein